MRRSALVKVPSFSRNDAPGVCGNTGIGTGGARERIAATIASGGLTDTLSTYAATFQTLQGAHQWEMSALGSLHGASADAQEARAMAEKFDREERERLAREDKERKKREADERAEAERVAKLESKKRSAEEEARREELAEEAENG